VFLVLIAAMTPKLSFAASVPADPNLSWTLLLLGRGGHAGNSGAEAKVRTPRGTGKAADPDRWSPHDHRGLPEAARQDRALPAGRLFGHLGAGRRPVLGKRTARLVPERVVAPFESDCGNALKKAGKERWCRRKQIGYGIPEPREGEGRTRRCRQPRPGRGRRAGLDPSLLLSPFAHVPAKKWRSGSPDKGTCRPILELAGEHAFVERSTEAAAASSRRVDVLIGGVGVEKNCLDLIVRLGGRPWDLTGVF